MEKGQIETREKRKAKKRENKERQSEGKEKTFKPLKWF